MWRVVGIGLPFFGCGRKRMTLEVLFSRWVFQTERPSLILTGASVCVCVRVCLCVSPPSQMVQPSPRAYMCTCACLCAHIRVPVCAWLCACTRVYTYVRDLAVGIRDELPGGLPLQLWILFSR